MNYCKGIAVILIVLCLYSWSDVKGAATRAWQPGNYKGVVINKTTKPEVVKKFGDPDWRSHPDKSIELLGYTQKGDFDGPMEISIRKGLVVEITMRPKSASRKAIISYFGSDFAVTHYDLRYCKSNNQLVPTESSEGITEVIEYPGRGIFVYFARLGDVPDIFYTNSSFTSTIKKCGSSQKGH